MQSIDNVLKLRKGLKPDDPNPDIFDVLWAKKLSGAAKEYTITGNPLSFTTKKAQTSKSTKVSMEPIQDLHGYDNPWPAGGGKNKFDKDDNNMLFNGYISSSDSIFKQAGSSTNTYRSILLPCLPNTTYTISNPLGKRFYVGYSHETPSNGTSIYGLIIDNEADSLTITTDSEAQYIVSYVYYSNVETYSMSEILGAIQIETGSTATSYTPYSNVCPISGRTGVEIKGCGKNLYPFPYQEKLSLSGSGDNRTVIEPTGSYNRSSIIRLSPNTTYTLSGDRTDASDTYARFATFSAYPKVGDVSIRFMSYARNNTLTFTTGTNELWGFVYSSTGYSDDCHMQLEEGSTSTEYESYQQSNDVTITFGETVYGGTIDVETGVLTVDKGMKTINEVIANRTTSYSHPVFYGSISDMNVSSSSYRFISDTFRYIGAYNSANAFANAAEDNRLGRSSTSNKQVYIRCDDYTTVTELKQEYGNVMIVYDLATPITIQLTPEQIQILKGQNTIWIEDEGATIALTYKN